MAEYYNHETERALLGACMLDTSNCALILDKADIFHDKINRDIALKITEKLDGGKRVDQVVIAGDLRKEYPEIDAYLLGCLNDCRDMFNATEYLDQLQDLANQRHFIYVLDSAAKEVDKDPKAIASAVEKINHYREKVEGQQGIDPWLIYSLADAFKDRPQPIYAVEGILKVPSLNLLFGPPSTLKTMLLQDLAVCVASGKPWLPSLPNNPGNPYKTTAAPVLWLDFDNGPDRTHERFEALARARDIQDAPLQYASMPSPGLNANDRKDISALITRCKRSDVKLVCVDNLGFISGGADENSGEMIQVMSNLRQLSAETGAAVVIIHHQRKSTGINGRGGDTIRGHSSIEASIDLGLQIERVEVSEKVRVKSVKTRGAEVEAFSALFTFDKKENGDLQSAMFYGMGYEEDTNTLAIKQAVLNALDEGEKPKTKLAEEIADLLPNAGINRIRDTIDILVAKHEIKMAPGPRNSKVCSK